MTYRLAFHALPAASAKQRARCARTGRFVAWAVASSLRVTGGETLPVREALPTPAAPAAAAPVAVAAVSTGGDVQSDYQSDVDAPAREAGLVGPRPAGLLARAASLVAGAVKAAAALLTRRARRVARIAGALALAAALAGDVDRAAGSTAPTAPAPAASAPTVPASAGRGGPA